MTKAETLASKLDSSTIHEKQFDTDFDFEKDLSIDKYRLDEECLSQATIFFRYAQASAEAKEELNRLMDKYNLLRAERSISLRIELERKYKRVTEGLIAVSLDKDEYIVRAKQRLTEQTAICKKLEVAVEAFISRKSQLDNLVKLYCAGYFSTPSSKPGAQERINDRTSNQVRENLNSKGDKT